MEVAFNEGDIEDKLNIFSSWAQDEGLDKRITDMIHPFISLFSSTKNRIRELAENNPSEENLRTARSQKELSDWLINFYRFSTPATRILNALEVSAAYNPEQEGKNETRVLKLIRTQIYCANLIFGERRGTDGFQLRYDHQIGAALDLELSSEVSGVVNGLDPLVSEMDIYGKIIRPLLLVCDNGGRVRFYGNAQEDLEGEKAFKEKGVYKLEFSECPSLNELPKEVIEGVEGSNIKVELVEGKPFVTIPYNGYERFRGFVHDTITS